MLVSHFFHISLSVFVLTYIPVNRAFPFLLTGATLLKISNCLFCLHFAICPWFALSPFLFLLLYEFSPSCNLWTFFFYLCTLALSRSFVWREVVLWSPPPSSRTLPVILIEPWLALIKTIILYLSPRYRCWIRDTTANLAQNYNLTTHTE